MEHKVNTVVFFDVPDHFESLLTQFCEVNNLSILSHGETEPTENQMNIADSLGIVPDEEERDA